MPTNNPLPVYTFRVNIIDPEVIFSQPLADTYENTILNLQTASVYVPYINRPLKNGDTFTLTGSRAIRVYDMYIGKKPRVLELIS